MKITHWNSHRITRRNISGKGFATIWQYQRSVCSRTEVVRLERNWNEAIYTAGGCSEAANNTALAEGNLSNGSKTPDPKMTTH